MTRILSNARDCARLLALVGYAEEAIAEALVDRFSLDETEARRMAGAAVRREAQRNAEDAAKLGKHEAAVEAEHDLDSTTWR